MPGIDSSIYFQQKPVDFIGSYERGMNMRQMADERALRQQTLKDEKDLKNAMRAGIIQKPDGTLDINTDTTFARMAQVNPIKAYEFKQENEAKMLSQNKAKIEGQLQKLDLGARILSGVSDQESFDKAIETGRKFGFDTSALGKYYDPNLIKNYQAMGMTAKDRLDDQYRKLDYQFKERNANLDDRKFLSDESYRNRQLLQKEREIESNAKTARQKSTPFEEERQKLAARDFQKSQQKVVNVNKNIDLVDEAMDSFNKYSKNTLFGTGPMASIYGLKSYVDQDTENLNAKLKAVNLKNMTTMFGGMSKAIDTAGERRAWEGQQADVTNDDLTNSNLLLSQKSILLKDKEEAKAQNQFVRQYGNLDGYESPIDGRVKTMVSSDGNMVLVPNEKVIQASKQGYYTIDEYAKKAISKTSSDGNSSERQKQVFRTNEIDWK